MAWIENYSNYWSFLEESGSSFENKKKNYFWIEFSFFRSWRRTCGWNKNGTTTSCDGIRRNTAAWRCSTFPPSRFGCRMSCFLIIGWESFLIGECVKLIDQKSQKDGNYEVTLMTKATLKYTGEVFWEPPAIYKSSCEMNVEYFPYDEQSCFMKFGSWTYNGAQVDLKHLDQVCRKFKFEGFWWFLIIIRAVGLFFF